MDLPLLKMSHLESVKEMSKSLCGAWGTFVFTSIVDKQFLVYVEFHFHIFPYLYAISEGKIFTPKF